MSKSNLKSSFKTKNFRIGGYSIAACSIVIIAAVLLNLLVSALPSDKTKIDVTSGKVFELSAQTKEIISTIDEDLYLYWISQPSEESRPIGLLLERYAALNSHIHVEKKDPDVYPTFAKQYTEEDIVNNTVIAVQGNRSKVIGYYDIFKYDYSYYWYTNEPEISFAGENAVTSAISYVLNDTIPVIYALGGHGETYPSAFEASIKAANLDIRDLSLLSSGTIPEDASCLLLSGPSSDLSKEETAVLRNYLHQGGNLFLLTALQDSGRLFPNLESLMADYGLRLLPGVVIEKDPDHFISGYNHYLIPEIHSHPITAPLLQGNYRMMLPVSQAISVNKTNDESISVYELLTSSEASFSKAAGYGLSTYEKEAGDVDGPFPVAVSITNTTESGHIGRIVWVTTVALLDDTVNQRTSGANEDFFINALSWMSGRDESISIHAKNLTTESLTISSRVASVLSLILIGVIPLLYLGIGTILFFRRKQK